ncbi:MAG: hypothetical protein WBG36_09635, partial [Ornithinimicrobium sp.]
LVPLDPSTTKVLVDYLTLPERLSTDPSPTGPIFVNNRGTGLVLETIEQHFRALSDALDLARPRLHDLRHYVDGGVMRPVGMFRLVGAVPAVFLSA